MTPAHLAEIRLRDSVTTYRFADAGIDDRRALLAALDEARQVAAQAVAANPSLEVLREVVARWSEP